MIKLTPEMRLALKKAGDHPVILEDDQTHTRYVLLPADQFERVTASLADVVFDAADAAAAQSAVAGAAGWDDAEMSVYDAHHAQDSDPRK